MNESKTIETINKFYSIIENKDASREAHDFINTYELELSKSLLNEFGKKSCSKLGHILIACSVED